MAYNRRHRFRNQIKKEIICECGESAKLRCRTNYPHGKKSKPVKTTFYKCQSCGETMIKNSGKGGKR